MYPHSVDGEETKQIGEWSLDADKKRGGGGGVAFALLLLLS